MQNIQPNPDRRKFKRLEVNFILTYQVNLPLSVRMVIGWDTEVVALMLDLSEEGMAISTNYDIPVSTVLLIKFTLINLDAPTEEQVKSMRISGKVTSNVLLNKGEHRLGIYFTHITQNDKIAVADFVKVASIKKQIC